VRLYGLSCLAGLPQNTTTLNYAGADISTKILAEVNAVSAGAVTSVAQVAYALYIIPDIAL
jgi:hypothetical protein